MRVFEHISLFQHYFRQVPGVGGLLLRGLLKATKKSRFITSTLQLYKDP